MRLPLFRFCLTALGFSSGVDRTNLSLRRLHESSLIDTDTERTTCKHRHRAGKSLPALTRNTNIPVFACSSLQD